MNKLNKFRIFKSLCMVIFVFCADIGYVHAMQDGFLSPVSIFKKEKEETPDLFTGELKDKVIIQQNGEYGFVKIVRLNDFTSSAGKSRFSRALIRMSQKVQDHKLTLLNYALSQLPGIDIYAAVDDSGGDMRILALQIVHFDGSSRPRASLSTWISSDRNIRFVANQVLAFAINDLIHKNIEQIDSSNVAYTKRVRKALPSGINNFYEMKAFLRENAENIINRLREDSNTNISAKNVLQQIFSSQFLLRTDKPFQGGNFTGKAA